MDVLVKYVDCSVVDHKHKHKNAYNIPHILYIFA